MHATCPVVVVRETSGAVHREVAVGVGAGDPCDAGDTGATLAFSFEEAARRDAALVAVHSWRWLPLALGGSPEARAEMRPAVDPGPLAAQAAAHLTKTLRRWRDKYPSVPVRQDVVRGHPGHVLASYTSRADLVVIGRHDTPGAGLTIGGVQHALLSHARGPVAIVPAVVASG